MKVSVLSVIATNARYQQLIAPMPGFIERNKESTARNLKKYKLKVPYYLK